MRFFFAVLLALSTGCGVNQLVLSKTNDVLVKSNPVGLKATVGEQEVTTPGVLHLARNINHTIRVQRGDETLYVVAHTEKRGSLLAMSIAGNIFLPWGWLPPIFGTVLLVSGDSSAGYMNSIDESEILVDFVAPGPNVSRTDPNADAKPVVVLNDQTWHE